MLRVNRYVWDGKVLLAVLDHTNGLVMSFMRGSDLSGSIQGAGGVGGVLAVKVGSAVPSGPLRDSTHFVSYDGNGNVVALTDAATGESTAVYEYGPFGEVLRATGPMAKQNPIRFSTRYTDDETDLVCYLHRYYSPGTGRWLSRDPIEERGSVNVNGFVGNDPISKRDLLGLKVDFCCGYRAGKAAVVPALTLFPPVEGVVQDDLQHCYVGCQIGKMCNVETGTAIGVIKEIEDLFNNSAQSEPRDVHNTRYGAVVCSATGSCLKCCREAKENGELL